MDLGAYVQIQDLGAIAEANGIEIPRLRGYRLMANETPATEEEIEKACKDVYDEVYDLYADEDTVMFSFSFKKGDKEHARREAEMCANATRKQMEAYNRYCGRSDVLLIHSRIGGNWLAYGGDEIERQPWFLEWVQDGFDGTYCDIYARIDPTLNGVKG